MRARLLLAVAMIAPGIVWGAPRLEIRGAAAHVTIIPEAREDIRVSVLRQSRVLPVRVVRMGAVTVVDGGAFHRVKGCPKLDSGQGVRVSGLGGVRAAELANIVVRAPLDVRLTVGDAVSGEVGRTSSLDFLNRGCGNWVIANVAGQLRIDQIGSGTTRAGTSRDAHLNVAGGGQIVAGRIAGPLVAVSSGEGTIVATAVSGAVVARVAGSGGVDVAQGAAPQLNASVAGSGSIRFGGEAGAVTASVAGTGEVEVAHARGPVSRQLFGAGRIDVGPLRR